ncbi:FAD-dependent oxidoreductase domain-containing protein 1 [Diprion similis]|uniref:FAD-dependent oxidoreductase domain-containing protein 1 n=1 Tax=Diprion similis TaxID=362088 RepID=UPI001EF82378|nr:FAD-dependent oxidoreductase domain-containing protein 1 [Diprion similis]
MLRHMIICRASIRINPLCCARIYPQTSNFHSTKQLKHDDNKHDAENPISRTLGALKYDFSQLKKRFTMTKEERELENNTEGDIPYNFPKHCDVIIIGGGAMGSSIAYWLKKRARHGLRVVVVEKDPTYQKCSSVLSAGGLRQQFSLEENIEMSLYGAEFIRNMGEYLSIEGEPQVDPQFHPYGYLFLASEAGADTLKRNSELQNSLGARNLLLTPEKLTQNFPWINTDGIELGCFGLQNEGWFDPWTLLSGLKNKAVHLGAEYIAAEAVEFEFKQKPNIEVSGVPAGQYVGLDKLKVRTCSGVERSIEFAITIIAAGAHSNDIAKMAKIGTGPGMLSVPLPVEPRKRYVYCFHSPDGPGLNTPLTIDPTGTYFRREGLAGNYICGRSPELVDEPAVDNLEVDYEYFDQKIWPILAKRVKAFENLKVQSSWAGFYEYNKFDENGIIGMHPYYHNLYLATGFSGHGIQHAPAVGRAISELIIDGRFETIDLTRLGFDRLITLEPMLEANIV